MSVGHALLWAALLQCSAGVRLQSSQDLAVKGAADSRHAAEDGPHKLAWFHAPASATSFGATLFHYANASLPRKEGARLLGRWFRFFEEYPPEIWFKDGLWHEQCDHAPVTDAVYQEFRGHFAGLFRSPHSRIASRWKRNSRMTLEEYARRANGTVALQLAGQEFGEAYVEFPGHLWCMRYNASEGRAPPPDLELAALRLRQGFMFVGLVEEFDLSVCLFHAMFGGECLPVEFENMRKGRPHPSYPELEDLYNIDQVLYDIAKKRFWADVKAHGVHREFCRKLCANASHIFAGEDEMGAGVARSGSSIAAHAERTEYDWSGRWFLDDDTDQ